MRYPTRIVAALLLGIPAGIGAAEGVSSLPVGDRPAPLAVDHFPTRLHALVWRNWGLVPTERVAAAVGATPGQVEAIAGSLGLPAVPPLPDDVARSIAITVVRRNWHLVPYEQLLTLLDMTPDRLAFMLREDDFLFIKLGSSKPHCEPIRYADPAPEVARRASEIKALVDREFGPELARPGEPPLAFVRRLSEIPAAGPPRANDGAPRFLHSYFGAFGDPLLDPGAGPYPDGLLARLAAQGVNGVWLHVVLRQIAPGGPDFPEFGADHEARLANLRDLVGRARRHGIDVYLYLNEPRAMPLAFFDRRPEAQGVVEADHAAMCTSDPRVLAWLTGAVGHVTRAVPGLGGVITITASENLTHCASHDKQADCPRCGPRGDAELIAGVNEAIAAGLRTANPPPKLLAWDWGWRKHGDAPEIIARLPKDAWLLSVSEWALPIVRGGVASTVGEYSISAVGPGPRAIRHWALARRAGLKVAAKVQLNATWELSAVPFLPVLDLVAEHCRNLAKVDIDGMMLGWSLGGYPSPNLRVAQEFDRNPDADPAAVLDAVAAERYGPAAAPEARRAWTAFSRAFREYPYDGLVVYTAPIQVGPANLLHARPTGRAATMVGFPYDALNSWRGPYPPETLADQFAKVADGWALGLPPLRRAAELAEHPDDALGDLRIAQAAQIHFASVANQIRFILARDRAHRPETTPDDRRRDHAHMRRILDDEARLARDLFTLARADSRIGFESSNRYYYTPHDLIEKAINCEYLKSRLDDPAPP